MSHRRRSPAYDPTWDIMLEDYILEQLPISDVKLFRKLHNVPYTEWTKALCQLFRDGCVTYSFSSFVAGDGQKHEGFVVGLGMIW